MPAITLPAKCINKQIVLTEPMEISENSELLVVILPRALQPEAGSSFQRDWAAVAAAGLERAYSEEEPEYTPAMLKEANPDYAAG
jgi:hypothetical protein